MISKVLILVVTISLQALVVLSQQQSTDFVSPSMTPAEMWNPYTWVTPYYTAASKTWIDYIQKAQDISNQLYKQWDKTGAGDAIALGMQYAQLAANEAQKGAETAMNQASSFMPKVN